MINAAALINLLGFSVGIALYALLLLMVVRHGRPRETRGPDRLLLLTAGLGLLWNAGELLVLFRRDFTDAPVSPLLLAASYSALGFLPSVVVHSAWKNDETEKSNLRWLTIAAYALSVFAALLHFESAVFSDFAPSALALRALTFGSLALLAGLLLFSFRQKIENKALWITALSVFALSALHLSGKQEEKSWLVELVAHQSSLPLAFAILLQDFRFAFADLFLKRAISLLLLASLAFGLYALVAVPLLAWHETHDRNDVQAAVLVIALWMATALAYPQLHRFAVWLVDKIILQRPSYVRLQAAIVRRIEKLEETPAVLDAVCDELSAAFSAREVVWAETGPPAKDAPAVAFTPREAEILVQTTEQPAYRVRLSAFAGGRRLLSDEIKMLEEAAVVAARRIDAVRVSAERHERELREEKLAKSATEAQLSALRAQINPHFLFNALTTIGYLINTAPEKAFQTLMKLTQLLRGVLRSTEEFAPLGDEIRLIENYLDIEKARFEDRLRVAIEIDEKLRRLRVPSLILQPLVENAVKHGISENKNGGELVIAAALESGEAGDAVLVLRVSDTGAGRAARQKGHSNGVGLRNIRERLASHYGERAALAVETDAETGTRAEIRLPVDGEQWSVGGGRWSAEDR